MFRSGKLIFLLFLIAPFQQQKTTVWMIGDSTMSVKDPRNYPEAGWGMPFAGFFDSTIVVENRALNGRSTKSFFNEKKWQPVLENMATGDYVFIQFGHNDEVPTKANATTEDEFQNNLRRYISETRSKGGIPVLITPVARRKFDSSGVLVSTHEVYSGLVRAVAMNEKVTLIDLDKKSQDLIRRMGVENSKILFNQLEPLQHPNYPAGIQDNTHFSEYGARRIAEIVLADIRVQLPELAARIVKRTR